MKIIGPRVLVKRLEPETSKSPLIEVVEFNAEPSQYAVVLGVGNGYQNSKGVRIPVDGIKVGDTVLITKYCGAPMSVQIRGEDVDTVMVMEDDVLAVVEG